MDKITETHELLIPQQKTGQQTASKPGLNRTEPVPTADTATVKLLQHSETLKAGTGTEHRDEMNVNTLLLAC